LSAVNGCGRNCQRGLCPFAAQQGEGPAALRQRGFAGAQLHLCERQALQMLSDRADREPQPGRRPTPAGLARLAALQSFESRMLVLGKGAAGHPHGPR
jgi:hypothetical protein